MTFNAYPYKERSRLGLGILVPIHILRSPTNSASVYTLPQCSLWIEHT